MQQQLIYFIGGINILGIFWLRSMASMKSANVKKLYSLVSMVNVNSQNSKPKVKKNLQRWRQQHNLTFIYCCYAFLYKLNLQITVKRTIIVL